MIKVKDGYAKLIGTTYKGSPDRVLLSNGGDKPLSDFATASGVVTALGTNGNYVTWTKNGTVNNLTVPYATKSNKLYQNEDLRNENTLPYASADYNKSISAPFLRYNSVDGLNDGGTYHTSIIITPWRDSSGGSAHNIGLTNNGNIWIRSGTTEWSNWKKIAFANDTFIKKGSIPLNNENICDYNLAIEFGAYNTTTSETAINKPFSNYGTLVSFAGGNDTWLLLASLYDNTSLYVRSGNMRDSNGVYNVRVVTDWKKVAFTDSDITGNSATATKLETSRTIWGLSFDGTQNVQGALSGATTITTTGNITTGNSTTTSILSHTVENNNGKIGIRASTRRGLYDYTIDTWLIGTDGTNTRLMIGNVGIGTSSPTQKLDVNGNVRIYSTNLNEFIIHRHSTTSGAYVTYKNDNGTLGILGLSNDTKEIYLYKGDDESTPYIIYHTGNLDKSTLGLGNVQNTAFYKGYLNINGNDYAFASTTNSSTSTTIYGPTTAGTSGQVLISSGGTPGWTNLGNITAGIANTANKLTTARTINVKVGGTTGTAQSFDGSSNITIPVSGMGEAYLAWGGKNISGSVSPIDAAMSNLHSANRLAFGKPDGITIEYSRDGSTWVDYGASDLGKINLVSGIGGNYIVGARNTGNTVNDKLRVTLHATNMGVYTQPKKLLLNIGTNYASNCTVTLEYATKGNQTSFSTQGTYAINGWTGWNSIPITFGYTFGGSSSLTSNIEIIRLTFSIGGVTTGSDGIIRGGLYLANIILLGDTYWSTPSTMAKTGHLYSYDYLGNATFPKNIITSGKITASEGFVGNASTATLASTVTVGSGSSNAYRAIVVHNGNSLYSAGNKVLYNYSTGDVKATSFTGKLNGSLVGGAKGNIIYQSDTDTTAFLANPSTNGYVLKFNTSTGLPYWESDNNTAYSAMSLTEANVGTETISRVITASVLHTKILNQIIASIGYESTGGIEESGNYISGGGQNIVSALFELDEAIKNNMYTLPLAASGTRGGILIGYSESGKNYAVKLSSEKAYVYVPWTDTKVTLTNTTTNANYRVLLSNSANDNNTTEEARKSVYLTFNPQLLTLYTGNVEISGEIRTTTSGTHPKFRMWHDTTNDSLYILSGVKDGSSTSGTIHLSGINATDLSNLYLDAINTYVKGAMWVYGGLVSVNNNLIRLLPLSDANYIISTNANYNQPVKLIVCANDVLNIPEILLNTDNLYISGSVTASGEITAYSDRRLKSNIKPLENRGYIQPMTYIKDNKECIGFIAQDVLEKYPELVNDNSEYLSLNYLQYVAVLQALIIELEKRVKELENGTRKL